MIEAVFRAKYNGVGKRLVLQQTVEQSTGDTNFTLGEAYGKSTSFHFLIHAFPQKFVCLFFIAFNQNRSKINQQLTITNCRAERQTRHYGILPSDAWKRRDDQL